MQRKLKEHLPFLSAVRFSVHAIGRDHDEIVGRPGSFQATDEALDLLHQHNLPSFVTTVVTPLNTNSIVDIADWCLRKQVSKYFLFGLMRSGLGAQFSRKNGFAKSTEISRIRKELSLKCDNQLEIVYYDYRNSAECILIYGDGRVVIDPYPATSSYQLEIGNILNEKPIDILGRFYEDQRNYVGYSKHLQVDAEPLA